MDSVTNDASRSTVPVDQAIVIAQGRQHNARFVWPCRLPAEVLTMIFKCAQRNEYQLISQNYQDPLNGFFDWMSRTKDFSWFHLLSTCTHMRTVGLSVRELWQHITVPGNQHWHDLCRTRARGLASVINVHFQCSNGSFLGIMDDICRQLPLASRAYLREAFPSDRAPAKTIIDVLTQPFCALEYLYFHCSKFHLTDRFLGGASTKLTTLVLHTNNAWVISSWPKFPNLLNLKLCMSYMTDVSHGNALLSWINQMTILEVLTLQFRPESRNSDHPRRFTINLHLSSLRILQLYGMVLTCHNIMSLLSTQPSIGLHLDLDTTWSGVFLPIYSCDTAYKDMARRILATPLQLRMTAKCSSFDELRVESFLDGPWHASADKPFFKVIAPLSGFLDSSVLSMVQILHVEGDRVGPAAGSRTRALSESPHIFDSMIILDTVIIDRVKTKVHITAMGKWLTQRKRSNIPIRRLEMCNPRSEKAKEALEAMATRLMRQSIIQEVVWS
jgi:hypothetical protein